MTRNYATMILPLLGALKVVLATLFGIEIPDQHFEAIANGIGALLIVVGIIMAHIKHPKVPDVQPSLPKSS